MAKVRTKTHAVSERKKAARLGQLAEDLSAPDLGSIISAIRKEIPELSSRRSKQLANTVHALFITMNNEAPCLKTNKVPEISLQVCEHEKALMEYKRLKKKERESSIMPPSFELQGYLFSFLIINTDNKRLIIIGYQNAEA